MLEFRVAVEDLPAATFHGPNVKRTSQDVVSVTGTPGIANVIRASCTPPLDYYNTSSAGSHQIDKVPQNQLQVMNAGLGPLAL